MAPDNSANILPLTRRRTCIDDPAGWRDTHSSASTPSLQYSSAASQLSSSSSAMACCSREARAMWCYDCSCKQITKGLAGVALAGFLFWTVSRAQHHLFAVLFSTVEFFRTRSLRACGLWVMIYVGFSLVCMPLTPLEIFTGFCFGIPLGITLDMIGRIVGATFSFCVARAIRERGGQCPCLGDSAVAVLRGVGQAVEEQGLRFLVLFNLAYVPVAVKNYGLGFVPGVPLHLFIISICIVEVPNALVWSFIGNAAAEEFTSEGISFSNSTSVKSALSRSKGGLKFKLCLLAVGVGSVLLVLSCVHSKVHHQLSKLSGGSGGEYDLLSPSDELDSVDRLPAVDCP